MLRSVSGMAILTSYQEIKQDHNLVGMIRIHVPSVPEDKLTGHIILSGQNERTVLEFVYDNPRYAHVKNIHRYAQLALSDSINMLLNDLSLPSNRAAFPYAHEWLEANADGIAEAYEAMEIRINHGASASLAS